MSRHHQIGVGIAAMAMVAVTAPAATAGPGRHTDGGAVARNAVPQVVDRPCFIGQLTWNMADVGPVPLCARP
jgi:hypothetical protein